VLLEERIRPVEPDRALPIELKLHTFGPVVAAIERNDRRPAQPAAHRYYTPAWVPFDDPMNTEIMIDRVVEEAPPVLEEMLALAARIGAAIGTYVRIDFFHGAGGLVFNEFAATPGPGKFTPYCDELFGRLWAEHAGDAL
jgi:hypothetical protein